MKRWKLTIENNNYQPLIYAETAEDAKRIFKSENVIDVKPYIDTSYLDVIEKIKTNSNLIGIRKIKDSRTQEWYSCQLQDGVLRYRLYKDLNDNIYYDIVEYQFMSKGSLVYPATFTYSNPTDMYNLFFTPEMVCEIVSYRIYGQPKLQKPSELKGVKQAFSVDFIPKKCQCQCFVKGNDLWIKHRDFFSPIHKPSDPKDYGTPLTYRLEKYFNTDKSYLDKFMYSDCWGGIVLRNEAWIVFRNVKQCFKRNKSYQLKTTLEKSFLNTALLKKSGIYNLNSDWDRFMEQVCFEFGKFLEDIDTEDL